MRVHDAIEDSQLRWMRHDNSIWGIHESHLPFEIVSHGGIVWLVVYSLMDKDNVLESECNLMFHYTPPEGCDSTEHNVALAIVKAGEIVG